jgi:hypothetical protein
MVILKKSILSERERDVRSFHGKVDKGGLSFLDN